MRFSRAIAPVVAAMALAAGLPAAAQVIGHSETSKKTVTTVPGHVSTNKVKVVHIKKAVPAPPPPAPGTTVHKTVTKKVHKTSVSSGQ